MSCKLPCRHTRHTPFLSLLFLALAWPLPAPGAAEEDLLALALRSPLEKKGDYDALARSWLEALPALAGEYRIELLIRRLTSLRGSLRDEMALLPLAEKALETEYAAGTVRPMLLDLVSDLYRRAGRDDDRKRVTAGRGYLLHWLVMGPFGKGRSSVFLRSFPPEAEQKLDATYKDGWQELAWRKAARASPEPRIEPFDFAYPSSGVVYLLAQVRSEREIEAVLQRGTDNAMQVWLNGTRVADDDPHHEQLENRRYTGIRLAKGWNRVLVKTRATFWMRICDPSGHSFPPGTLIEEEGRELHPVEGAPDPRWPGPFNVAALAPWAAWVKDLTARDAASGDGAGASRALLPDARIGLAMLFDAYGRDELAVAEAQKALKALPEDAFIAFHAGDIFRRARYLPATVSKNRAQGAFEAALKADPAFVPAYERVASFLEEDEKPAQAALKVKEALEREPAFLPGLLRLQSIYSSKSWEAERIEVMRELERVAPSSTAPALFWASHSKNLDNLSGAVEWCRKAIDLDRGNYRHRLLLAELEQQRGRRKEAEDALREAVRLEPDLGAPAGLLGSFLANQDRVEEALSLARSRAERDPDDPGEQEALAELLDKAGRKDLALEALRKARALDPGRLKLRRALARLETVPPPAAPASGDGGRARMDEFWAPYDEKLEDWFLQVPQEGPLVDKAASIIALDITVTRVELDGSSSEYVHQATKLLTEESKEDQANVRTSGEVVLLRTVTPSGESLEPVAAEGGNSWVMPGLEKGAFVEYAYRADSPERHGGELRLSAFYFQDMRFKESFLVSRYVLLLPEGVDPGILESNVRADARERQGKVELARVEKTVRELAGGGKAIIYEARNVPRLEREQLMPSAEEYVPNVQVREKTTWEEVAGDLRGRYAGSTLATPELDEEARKVTQGIEDPVARARALYEHVNKIVPTEGRSSRAAQVLLEKAGNRNVLYKALLDLSGVPAEWAFLRPKEAVMPRTDWAYPSAGLFSYTFVAVLPEGKAPLFVSLSDRQTPFGRLSEHLQGGKALLVGEKGHRIALVEAESLEASSSSLVAALKLEDGVDVACDVELISRSVTTSAQKEQLKTLPAFQKDLVLRQIVNQMFPGAKVKSCEMKGLDEPEKPFAIAASLTAPKLIKKSGDGFLLKPLFQPLQMVKSFAGRSQREHPCHFRSQRVSRDAIRVEGGASYRLERTPSDVTLVSALGTYSLAFKTDGNGVAVTRELTLLPGRLTADEFPAFVDFCEQVDAAERESIIFQKL